jgi:hypothetical protein
VLCRNNQMTYRFCQLQSLWLHKGCRVPNYHEVLKFSLFFGTTKTPALISIQDLDFV